MGVISVFVPEVETFKSTIETKPDADLCSIATLYKNYTTLVASYGAKIDAEVALGEAKFENDFGFKAGSTLADLKTQFATLSKQIDGQVTAITEDITDLSYFITNRPSYSCSSAAHECKGNLDRLKKKYGTQSDTLAKRQALVTTLTAQQTELKANQTMINDDGNLIHAGDHKEFHQKLYTCQDLMGYLSVCYDPLLQTIKEQLIDKLTEALVEAAASLLADLLGVGIAKLAIKGVIALASLIEDVYYYIKASDDDKPTYLGKMIGEVLKFVIEAARKRKIKRKVKKF